MTTTEQAFTRINEFRTKANQARSRFAAAREEINAEPSRTQQWKQEQIAQTRAQHVEELKKLEAEERGYVRDTKMSLGKIAFGMDSRSGTTDIVAYRDAYERASNIELIDQQRAVATYHQAILSSDKTMMQALAARANDVGWHEVLGLHFEQFPDRLRAFETLTELNRFENDMNNHLFVYAAV